MDGADRLVVRAETPRAALRATHFSNTNVSFVPVISVDGIIAGLLVFRYDGKSQKVKREIQREQEYVAARLQRAQAQRDAGKLDDDGLKAELEDILAEVRLSGNVADPSSV